MAQKADPCFCRQALHLLRVQYDLAILSQCNTNIKYGIGRPLQTVVKKGSLITNVSDPASAATATDMVSTAEYDQFGRESFKYLPSPANNTGGNTHISDGLFKLNPFQQQAAFYDNNNSSSPITGQGETYFYGQTQFEPSPLNRVSKALPPGDNWAGSNRGAATKYYFNTDADAVRLWNVTDGTLGTLGSYASPRAYMAGTLYKTITEDENNKQVIEFKDMEGRVVLKKVQLTAAADDGSGSGHTGWLCTYYIYDEGGNLRCVVQPRGVELISSNWVLTDATILAEQCFRYEYDARNRMIIKKVSGAGEVNMVYDARDRLVMTQDADMLAQGKWLVTKYDGLNRPVETGLWTNGTTASNHRTTAAGSTDYPQTPSGYELLTQAYYDDYNWIGASGSTITNTNYETSWDSYLLAASTTLFPYAVTNTKSTATKGMVTGTKTKVLGTTSYLFTITIYDEKGRVIQFKSTNLSSASDNYDVVTTQYGWQGLPLVIVQKQQKSGTNAQTVTTVTKNNYDDLGRIIKVEKRQAHSLFNSGAMSAYATISQTEYDALGQVKKKELGTAPLETLTYDYNIRGWLLGANRDYISQSTTSPDKHFGFDLGYDKNGVLGTYTHQYTGNISGTVWKSEGDKEKRKYDFIYDAANRLTAADFNQYTSSAFNKTAGVDFSVSGLTYDANGNISGMNQKGLKINASSLIDQLTYTYQSNSNKLSKVADAANDNASTLGDFKYDPATKGATDYSYDSNGNLTSDANKKISSITYNYLNLPQVITVTGKGTVTYTYDAAGNKLKKVTQENSATVPYNGANYTSNITTTTTYIGGAVYESKAYSNSSLASLQYTDVLQFIAHEEGRIRPVRDASNNITALVYDYFLKDHLGNVRMVLTEEQKTDAYPPASMETAEATTEEALYANVSTTRVTKPSGYPTDNYTNPNNNVAKVSGSGNKIGPSITLKVMAGDTFNIRVSSWYKKNGATPNSPNSIATDLVSNLISSLTGTGGPVHGTITSTQLTNSGVMPTTVNNFLSNQPAPGSTKPKAYLNWILLDEQFKFVQTGSSAEQVGDDQEFKVHTKNNLPVTRSGYLYVFVSNETPNIDVFFDNLQVTHVRGAILEETHYYPFGLTMAGISSKAALGLENKYKYNGIELDTSLGLNEYEAALRNLDPQTGRWWQVDPETENQEMWSPYASNNDNPILYKDPRGNEGEACCEWLSNIVTTVVATTSVVVDNVLGTNVTGTIANSGAIPSSQTATWNNAVTTANQTSVATGMGASVIGGGIATGSAEATLASGGTSSVVTAPAFLIGAGTAVVGTIVTANASKNLAEKKGLIREKNAPPGTYDNKPAQKEKNRVVNQKPGEAALNQSEGLHKAKTAAAKNKPLGQAKQSKINKTDKSDDRLQKQLDDIKTLDDANKNFN